MGLSSSMWTSVSGLLTHGEKMSVVSNNIANINTIGFKSQRMDFNDYLYIDKGTVSGTEQIGAGVSVYAVLGDFSQGALQSTNSVTDIAIDGNGFFRVRQPNSENYFYTRAGDFYFNADRKLQNPEGYYLQGWKVDNDKDNVSLLSSSISVGTTVEKSESPYKGTGSPKDIVLDSWYLKPNRTDSVMFTMGLVSGGNNDNATSTKTAAGVYSPATALFDTWDATKSVPISSHSYATSSDIKVYDETGCAHTLTVYYDEVMTKGEDYTITNLPAGYSMYEYIVTCDPAQDLRSYGGAYKADGSWVNEADVKYFNEVDADGNFVNKNAGMLMTGHLIFDASGNLVQQTAYTIGSTDTVAKGTQWNGNINDPGAWKTAQVSGNGFPVLCANFTGTAGASCVMEGNAEKSLVELDLGFRGGAQTLVSDAKTLHDLQAVAPATASDPYTIDYKNFGFIKNGFRTENGTSATCSSFVTQDARQNGFASGVLSNVNIDNSGVVYGYYDNGETIPLYQISLYDFHNDQGLRREGGNLFAKTRESGEPMQGVAGDNGFGATRAYNIENSNVDLSTELVNMITTQRGFQANSKGITTVDTMFEQVINMKR